MVISFINIKKAYLQILENMAQFFAHPFFKYQETILTNPVKPGSIFRSSIFQLLKKGYLRVLKNLAQFSPDSFFKY